MHKKFFLLIILCAWSFKCNSPKMEIMRTKNLPLEIETKDSAKVPFRVHSEDEEFGFASNEKFARYSLLKNINTESAIVGPDVKYPICFEFNGLVSEEKITEMFEIMNISIGTWIAPLQDQWGVDSVTFVRIMPTNGRCPSYEPESRERNIRQWLNVLDVKFNGETERSFASVLRKEIHISKRLVDDPYRYEAVFLHELGHILGLADTYTEEGVQNPEGSPVAIMNIVFEYFDPVLYKDDIDGIRHIWAHQQSGIYTYDYCPEGYVKGKSETNTLGLIFCILENQGDLVDEHPDCKNFVEQGLCSDTSQPYVRDVYCEKSCSSWSTKVAREDVKKARRMRRERRERQTPKRRPRGLRKSGDENAPSE